MAFKVIQILLKEEGIQTIRSGQSPVFEIRERRKYKSLTPLLYVMGSNPEQ